MEGRNYGHRSEAIFPGAMNRKKVRRCPACGDQVDKFVSEHLRLRSNCREYYIEEGKLVKWFDDTYGCEIILDSVRIKHHTQTGPLSARSWSVVAFDKDNVEASLTPRMASRVQCVEYIEKEFGDLVDTTPVPVVPL